ncbi:MAG: DUF4860 domain-containing protein [Lachnospiraceae bacterium]|nr:DUF4860 domain-containing protein [Lachnospiraceae bacterium]
MEHDRNLPMAFYTMGIACLFLAGFFLIVLFGAKTYRNAVSGQTDNNSSRVLLSYLTTAVRTGDSAGAVTLSEEDGSQVVSIADGDSGYCFRVYWQDGRLMEEYGQTGARINPDAARVIGETERFLVEKVTEDTFAVTTDAGRVLFHVRSREAADGQEGSR